MLLASLRNSDKYIFYFFAYYITFDCSSNATKAIRIVHFIYICIRRCFLSYDFILGKCLHNILSPKIKFYFCQKEQINNIHN